MKYISQSQIFKIAMILGKLIILNKQCRFRSFSKKLKALIFRRIEHYKNENGVFMFTYEPWCDIELNIKSTKKKKNNG